MITTLKKESIKPKTDETLLETVLLGAIPPRVPWVEFEVDFAHIAKVLKDERIAQSEEISVENYVEFVNRVGIDVLFYNCLWKVGRVYRKSSDGRNQYVDGNIKSRDDFYKISAPDLENLTQRAGELSVAAKKNNTAFVVGLSTPYKLAKAAVGYEDFLIKTAQDISFLLELEERLMEHTHAILRECLKYDVSAIMIPGDMCGKHGALLAPESISRLWLKSTNEFIKPIRERGIPVILHVDGDFSGVLDILMKIEPDALHPFEVCGNLDIYNTKQSIGDRVTLMGNIDLNGVLTFGTAEEVRESVLEHILRLAPNGRYACGSSHEIGRSVPFENFMAMSDAIKEFGKYTI